MKHGKRLKDYYAAADKVSEARQRFGNFDTQDVPILIELVESSNELDLEIITKTPGPPFPRPFLHYLRPQVPRNIHFPPRYNPPLNTQRYNLRSL